MFAFHGAANINQYAAYAQDSMTFGHLTFNIGSRPGPLRRPGVEVRSAAARWASRRTLSALEPCFARRTPEPSKRRSTENRCCRAPPESAAWPATSSVRSRCPSRPVFPQSVQWRLAAVDRPVFPHRRRLFLEIHAANAFDFSTLLNTTITFPIAWNNTANDGVTGLLAPST